MNTERRWEVINADCRDALKNIPDCSIDAIVTDPPYELGFMGKSWDATGVAYSVDVWRECLRVLKHGGHLLAFGGSRTYHRLACAVEDAGFQIRDQIMWIYGSGFPKSLDVSKAIDKQNGIWRGRAGEIVSGNGSMSGGNYARNPKGEPATDDAKQWQGWGTALKPAHEPIVLARKALDGTVAQNVLWHGVGGLNIDGCRIGSGTGEIKNVNAPDGRIEYQVKSQGRFPANFIHDGSDEIVELMPDAARFFYCAKANKTDRNEGLEGFAEQRPDTRSEIGMGTFTEKGIAKQSNFHPTVKPTMLMRYLCRLITPPEGTILDPFTGSGSTGKAAMMEGFNFVGIEQSEEYCGIARARIEFAERQ